MNALFTVLTILVLLASILITLIVLLQNGKGGGLASNFVAGNQTFGVRQTADILEKITWGLVAFIFIVSVVTTFSINSGSRKVNPVDQIQTEEVVPEFQQEAAAPAAEATEEAEAQN